MSTRELTSGSGEVRYQPLLSEDHANTGKAVEVADMIFQFPNPFMDAETKKSLGIKDEETIDGNDFLDAVFVAKKPPPANPSAYTTFKKLADVCKDKKPTKKAVQIALLEDFCTWFSNCGWQVKLFKSMDEDEIFMRISIDNFQVQEFYAEKGGIRMQLTPKVVEALGILQPYDEISPAYIPYDDEVVRTKTKELNIPNLFKKYYAKYKDGIVFRTVDRVNIIYRIVMRIIDLDAIVEQKMMNANFPVHYRQSLNEFRLEWANFRMSTLMNPKCPQPIDRVRDYFGESIAFYFAWIGYTVRAFIAVSIVGMAVKIFEVIEPFGKAESRAIGSLVFMVFMVIWSSVYTKFWLREEKWWTAKWDMTNAEQRAATRTDFRGTMLPDPVDQNEKTKQYPHWKKMLAQFFSTIVTIVFLGVVLGCVGYVFSLKDDLKDRFGRKKAKTASSIIMSVQIKVFNTIWGFIAPCLVNLENPKTDIEYSNSLIWKLFSFQAINSYNSFVYIAIFQGQTIGCPEDDCIEFLQSSLYSTFGSLCAISFVEMAVPYAKLWWSLRQEKKAMEARMTEKNMSTAEIPKRSFMEKQGKMAPYTLEDKITDELTVVITLGYVLLFCVVAPGVSIIALCVLAIQVRCDAWKLCSVHLRPRPRVASGIGAWNSVLEVLSWAGICTSVAIPILNLHYLDDKTLVEKVMIFFAVERAMFLLKALFFAIPTMPARVELMMARRQKVVDVLFMGKDSDANLAQGLKQPPPSLTAIEGLHHKSAEWGLIEHDGDEDDGTNPNLLREGRDDAV